MFGHKRSQAPVDKTARGQNWERYAQRHLERAGYRLIDSNYRCKFGEIDLLMRAPDRTVVFVEVRYRAQSGFGSPLETVGPSKQRRIRLAASHFLQHRRVSAPAGFRFDVIGISGSASEPALQWVQAAFH